MKCMKISAAAAVLALGANWAAAFNGQSPESAKMESGLRFGEGRMPGVEAAAAGDEDGGVRSFIQEAFAEKTPRMAGLKTAEIPAPQGVEADQMGKGGRDDLKIGFLGLKRWLVKALPPSVLRACLEAKFKFEGNLGDGLGWEHERRYEALASRYLRELKEGRKLRKYE